MADFSMLPVHRDGYGLYHINRFRLGLKKNNPGSCLALLSAMLYLNFTRHIVSDYAPVCEQSRRTFEDHPVVRFVGMASLGGGTDFLSDAMVPDGAHDDYVAFISTNYNNAPMADMVEARSPTYGMTAQTLKRLFDAPSDAAARKVGDFVKRHVSRLRDIPVDELIEINKRHFLAGRRSWRIGTAQAFGYRGGEADYIVESAAIERFSHAAYDLVDMAGLDNFYNGNGAKVTNIWTTMLENFARSVGSHVSFARLPHHDASHKGATWRPFGRVLYLYQSYEYNEIEKLEASYQFKDVVHLHPDIYPRWDRRAS